MRVRCLLTACPATEVEVEEREETTLEVSRSHQEVQGRTIGAGESAAAATNWWRLMSSGERCSVSRVEGRAGCRRRRSESPATSTLAQRRSPSL